MNWCQTFCAREVVKERMDGSCARLLATVALRNGNLKSGLDTRRPNFGRGRGRGLPNHFKREGVAASSVTNHRACLSCIAILDSEGMHSFIDHELGG